MPSIPSSQPETACHEDATPAVLAIAAVVFLGLLTMGLVLPALPARVHDELGFDTVTVGWVMATQSAATLLSRPWTGAQTDRRGGKHAALIGLVAMSGSGVAYALSAVLLLGPEASLWVLMGGRMLVGVGEGLIITGGAMWAIGRAGMDSAGRAMSWIGLAMFAGLAAGAAAGAAVHQAFGFTILAITAAIVPLVGVVAASVVAPALLVATPEAKPISAARVAQRIWQAGLALAFSAVGFAMVSSFVVLTYGERGWTGGASALVAFSAGHMAARLVFGRFVDNARGSGAAVFVLSVEATGLGILWVASSPPIALAGAALSGIGYSLVYPLLALQTLRRVPATSRGMAIGIYDGFFDVAMGVSALLGGVTAALFGLPSVFLFAALTSVLAVLAAVWAYRLDHD